MEWDKAFNFGLPTAILAVVCYALWKVASWAKEKVVEPIVASHLTLIATLKEEIPLHGRKLKEVADTASAVADKQEKQLNEIKEELISQTGVLKFAIDYQTQCIEDRAARKPDPGSLHTPTKLPPQGQETILISTSSEYK